jgi:hypothetical protein
MVKFYSCGRCGESFDKYGDPREKRHYWLDGEGNPMRHPWGNDPDRY